MPLESNIRPIKWADNKAILLDQTKLPEKYEHIDITTYQEMADAISTMIVRGAPAIGVSGAFGMALAAIEFSQLKDKEEFISNLKEVSKILKATRPTAVNLSWALKIQEDLIEDNKDKSIDKIKDLLIKNAVELLEEDIDINTTMGEFGKVVVPKGATVLTHCNAGALATAGYGTALGVIRSAFNDDDTLQVFADETRPRQQGARLTTWELAEDNIPVTLITDGMCSYFMKNRMIDVVIVGADRIAANGDTANKIGTYTVAIAAKEHNVPFYIAAPLSTIDTNIKSGDEIPIEERSSDEVTHINGGIVCSDKVKVINPGFDVTPNKYIAGIITEKGILRPDYVNSIKEAFEKE